MTEHVAGSMIDPFRTVTVPKQERGTGPCLLLIWLVDQLLQQVGDVLLTRGGDVELASNPNEAIVDAGETVVRPRGVH